MKPILYNETVLVYKEYKYSFPLNRVVQTSRKIWSNRLLNCRLFSTIKKGVGFLGEDDRI